MPQPLAITLRPPAAATADGEGAAVDIGAARTAARLTVTATDGPPQRPFQVAVQTSPDGVGGWVDIDEPLTIGVLGALDFSVAGAQRFLRVRWSVPESPVTFGVAGVAHQVYCSPHDIGRYGLREQALLDITTQSALADACITVSAEADGYLGGRYVLPLVAWDDDLRAHCARMAARYALDASGWQPGGPDEVVERSFDRAIAWLKRLQAGQLAPPGIVDSTPTVFEGGSVVVSRPRRFR